MPKDTEEDHPVAVSPLEEYWIFGYGSLIWKPPPHYDRRVPGFIKGYVRRFWQASHDHRGTPDSPGRVVTLITREHWRSLKDEHESPEAEVTWGVAFRIDPLYAEEVKANLDEREINGYTIQSLPVFSHVHDVKPAVVNATVYIGTIDNFAFAGPMASIDTLAEHIYKSKGQSGENKEYLYNLAEALRELSPESQDRHVWDLEERVKILDVQEALTSKRFFKAGGDKQFTQEHFNSEQSNGLMGSQMPGSLVG